MEGIPLSSLDMNPALLKARQSDLTQKPTQGKAAMERVAKEFESVFVSLMLKEMRNTLDEGFFGSESSDVLGGMFDQFLGQHIAASSPFGLQQLLVAQKFAPGTVGADPADTDNQNQTANVNSSADKSSAPTDTSLTGETES